MLVNPENFDNSVKNRFLEVAGCLFWSAAFLSASFLFSDFCHIIASNIIFPKMICR
ncbi:MAG: hypothetical protein LBC74_03605 [Planctomycetaceae bacterium]|jgi:hypothetical protein|nr:hypothetical protein [Planctomycetaceae bacterium]